MTAFEKLTAILARTPGIPDSTPITMGGEVELEVTIGDLRMLAATLAKALASANHQRKQKQASNISRNRAVQGIEHWKARAEAAEADLARAREIMKPFADHWRDEGDEKGCDDDHVPDDVGVYGSLNFGHFRAVSRFLTEGEGGLPPKTFQERVLPWMTACFGWEIAGDKLERGDRLLEEVFELLQAGAYPSERVAQLRDYTWSRPVGEPGQETGGVMVTLAAYCLAHDIDMHEAGETELARIWTKVDAIRAKQAAKPRGIALPVAPLPPEQGDGNGG